MLVIKQMNVVSCMWLELFWSVYFRFPTPASVFSGTQGVVGGLNRQKVYLFSCANQKASTCFIGLPYIKNHWQLLNTDIP